jgi:predicted lipoprotein with Yx(FWY)xxD motif
MRSRLTRLVRERPQARLFLTASVVAAAFIAAACSPTASGSSAYGSANPAPSAAAVAAPSPSAPPPATGTAINVGSSKLGQVLVDANGLTVYLFLADKGTVSSCNSSSCVQYWPPVLTTGAPQAGPGLTATLLGTTTRADGTTQVTYAGHPLYRFINDKTAGQATGQGVNAFGAPWYVVSPSGAQIG